MKVRLVPSLFLIIIIVAPVRAETAKTSFQTWLNKAFSQQADAIEAMKAHNYTDCYEQYGMAAFSYKQAMEICNSNYSCAIDQNNVYRNTASLHYESAGLAKFCQGIFTHDHAYFHEASSLLQNALSYDPKSDDKERMEKELSSLRDIERHP